MMFPRGRSINKLQNLYDRSPGLVSLRDMQYRVKHPYWFKDYGRTDYMPTSADAGNLQVAFDGRTHGVVHSENVLHSNMTGGVYVKKPILVPSNVFPARNSALDFNLAAQLTDPAWMPAAIGTNHDHSFYDTVVSGELPLYSGNGMMLLLIYPTSFSAGTICSMGKYYPFDGPPDYRPAPANILLANTPSPGQISLSCLTGGVVVPNYMVTTAVLQLNKPQVVAFVQRSGTWEIWHEGVRRALTTIPPGATTYGTTTIGHTKVRVGGAGSILAQSNFFSGLVGGYTTILGTYGTTGDLSSVTAGSYFFYQNQ